MADDSRPRGGTRRELIVAAFLVAFGGGIIAVSRTIPPGVSTDPLGPRAFPIALGAGIGLCGLLLGAAALVFRGRPGRAGLLADADPDEEAGGEAGPFSPARLVGAIVATGAYLAVFEPLGYLLATPPYVAAIMLIHGSAVRRALLIAPLLTTAALYATFQFGLRIPVPGGILERILPW
ncbi:MAG: tripartite tricarboxylate transporter TctB family protein [Armatimonadota bacterium]